MSLAVIRVTDRNSLPIGYNGVLARECLWRLWRHVLFMPATESQNLG